MSFSGGRRHSAARGFECRFRWKVTVSAAMLSQPTLVGVLVNARRTFGSGYRKGTVGQPCRQEAVSGHDDPGCSGRRFLIELDRRALPTHRRRVRHSPVRRTSRRRPRELHHPVRRSTNNWSICSLAVLRLRCGFRRAGCAHVRPWVSRTGVSVPMDVLPAESQRRSCPVKLATGRMLFQGPA